jgi:hypothetical protein
MLLTEEKMGNKKTLRAPVSQKSLTIEIPEHPEFIGGTVSIEINEKKFSVPLGTILKPVDKTKYTFPHFVVMKIYVLRCLPYLCC